MNLRGTPVLEFLLDRYMENAGKYDKIGFVLEGSSGSSKTYSILQFLYIYMQANVGKRIVGAAESRVRVVPTIWNDFLLMSRELEAALSTQNTTLTGYYNSNSIRFTGTDDPKKLHGPRQDVFWYNEAMTLSREVFNQLNMRTNEIFLLDYNPSADKHWIFSDLLKGMKPCRGGGQMKVSETVDAKTGKTYTEAVFYLHSTFKDNPLLPPGQRKVLMGYEPTADNIANGTADEWHWNVYGLGVRAAQSGAIFKNWKFHVERPEGMGEPLAYWLDFGYVNDPSACGRIWKHRGELWVEECFYETELTNVPGEKDPDKPSLHSRFKEHGVKAEDLIIADSAEQKSINELRDRDWCCIPISKGAVNAEISRLSKWRVNVIESPNIADEVRQYCWVQDRMTGKAINKPIDKYNHHMDGIRYAVKYLEERGII